VDLLQRLKRKVKCYNLKKTKFRKFQKRTSEGVKYMQLNFGTFGLQALDCGHLSASCIEAARRAMSRKLKRTGQIWIRVFPDYGVSKKTCRSSNGKRKRSGGSLGLSREKRANFI
jgi:large subunit ribosomal protein L16